MSVHSQRCARVDEGDCIASSSPSSLARRKMAHIPPSLTLWSSIPHIRTTPHPHPQPTALSTPTTTNAYRRVSHPLPASPTHLNSEQRTITTAATMSAYPCHTCNASPCCCHYTGSSDAHTPLPTTLLRFPCMTCASDPCCCHAKDANSPPISPLPTTFLLATADARFPCMTCASDPCCCHTKDDGGYLCGNCYQLVRNCTCK